VAIWRGGRTRSQRSATGIAAGGTGTKAVGSQYAESLPWSYCFVDGRTEPFRVANFERVPWHRQEVADQFLIIPTALIGIPAARLSHSGRSRKLARWDYSSVILSRFSFTPRVAFRVSSTWADFATTVS
jgi:hypothetical protein